MIDGAKARFENEGGCSLRRRHKSGSVRRNLFSGPSRKPALTMTLQGEVKCAAGSGLVSAISWQRNFPTFPLLKCGRTGRFGWRPAYGTSVLSCGWDFAKIVWASMSGFGAKHLFQYGSASV